MLMVAWCRCPRVDGAGGTTGPLYHTHAHTVGTAHTLTRAHPPGLTHTSVVSVWRRGQPLRGQDVADKLPGHYWWVRPSSVITVNSGLWNQSSNSYIQSSW